MIFSSSAYYKMAYELEQIPFNDMGKGSLFVFSSACSIECLEQWKESSKQKTKLKIETNCSVLFKSSTYNRHSFSGAKAGHRSLYLGKKKSVNHRIIGQLRLEGTSKDCLVQHFMGNVTWKRLRRTLSSHILKTSSHGDSTTALGEIA